MSDIFQEVEEDIKEEKYKSIWRRYRNYIISFIVLIVVGVSLNAFWKQQSSKEVTERSEKFFDAIALADEDNKKAIILLNEFSSIEKESSEFNVVLSSFKEAALRREEKDFSGALEIYENLININMESFYSDYARLLSAEVLISMNKTDEAVNLLEILILNSSPLLLIAKEYLVYIEIKRGNLQKASIIFKELFESASASEGMKNRAKEILSMF